MSRKSRQQSLRQSKERRQKQIAVGGAILLAILLAFELPHYLGGGSSSSSPPAGTTAATATTATTAAANGTPTASASTSPSSAAAAMTPRTHTRLPNSDVPPARKKSQLASFEHFDSKDPFVQQVSAETAPTSPAPAPALGGSSAPAGGGPSNGVPAQQTAARVTLGRETAATIEVNGKPETVQVGSTFPSTNPIFKLVSLSNGAAEIGIANGAYSSGAQTVSLTVGNPLTLVDTADGVRYELQLLSGS